EPGEPGRLLRERIQALDLERDILDVRIKRATPRAASRASAPAVAAVQELLEPNAALLEYALLPEPARHEGAASAESRRIALWVVTHAGLRTFLLTLPAGKPTATFPEMALRLRIQPDELGLEERIRLYRFPMERRLQTQGGLSTREHQLAGRLLADALLPPAVQDHLAAAGVQQLVIVPDGVLHHVPFPALILREDLETAGLPRYEACRFLVH